MDSLARKLISGTNDEFSDTIVTFLENCGNRTVFEELNNDRLRESLWNVLCEHLADPRCASVHCHCLAALRVLSRDKTNLNELITDDMIKLVLQNAELLQPNINEEVPCSDVSTESLKLLCNLLFNSTKVQHSDYVIKSLSCVINRISKYNSNIPYEAKLFHIRVLFLITALNVSVRHVVKAKLNGDVCLTNLLKEFCEKYGDPSTLTPDNKEVALACEILKVLFNLYIQSDDKIEELEEEERNKDLVDTLRKLLISVTLEKQEELQSNIVNLLTVTPYSCYSSFVRPTEGKDCELVYQDMDMTAVSVLLRFLDCRLNSKTDLIENLSPVITALVRLIRTERLIRKYIRLQVLPPLKDVMKRPEEGTTLRAKLCKLLTSPITELRDLAAEFLFILCKENVSRMVKYTGYGNAAGMFANKGLLGRGGQAHTCYSSESEDSETEEYQKYKEQINPVTGCFEKPKPNPLEGMTEEQKEYEALQLVGLVDKLTREGVVHPCRIGEDGKPKPIEHVLQLQEELPKQQFNHRECDSDSD